MHSSLSRRVLACLFPLLLLAASACGDDSTAADSGPADAGVDATTDAMVDAGETGPIMLRFDLAQASDQWQRPWPLDALRRADGHPDMSGWLNPRHLDVIDAFITIVEEDTTGFSTSGPVYLPYNGPLDVASLSDDPSTYRDDTASPIFLVNIDPDSAERGTKVPLLIGFTPSRDPYRPANLLEVLPAPGFQLAENTLYAVVVRDTIGSADSMRPLMQAPELAAALSDTAPTGDLGAKVGADFAPLRAWLTEQSIDAASVVGATVYRTGDETSELYRLAAWANEQPAPSATEAPTMILEMPEYCAYMGAWEPPQFQDGTPPFSSAGGRLQLDGSGVPIEQRTERSPFVIAVPKGAMPADGIPLLFYVNGTGGLARQVIDRGVRTVDAPPPPGTGPAQIAAMHGYGASGMSAILTDERLVDAGGGYLIYNFYNPVGMRDNFSQTVIEHILFRKLVLGLRIDPSTCTGTDASAAADGMVRYDPNHRVVMGQSLGSYLSGMLATLDPGYQGAILTGAGGSWVDFPFGVRSPDLGSTIHAIFGVRASDALDPFHPGIALFDLGLARAQNLHYVKDVLRHPRPGAVPPHVLVIEGDDDDNIGTDLQRALNASMGTDLVGPDTGDERIEPWILLGGHEVLPPPVSLNVMTTDGPRTAGVVRYLPDRNDGGHYVTFQLEGPKHQYGCFLETLFQTGTPVIPAPGAVDDPCD